MKRTRPLNNLTEATNANLRPVKKALLNLEYTPTSGNYESNNNAKITDWALYIKGKYDTLRDESENSPSLRIFAKPPQFKRKSDGAEFEGIYSHDAHLYYPNDLDEKDMIKVLGGQIGGSKRKSRRATRRRPRKSRKARKVLK